MRSSRGGGADQEVGEPAALARKPAAAVGGPRCARHGGGERGVVEPAGCSSLHFNSVRRSRLRLGSGSTSLLPTPTATRWSVWPKPSVRTATWSTSRSWGRAGARWPDCGWGRSASATTISRSASRRKRTRGKNGAMVTTTTKSRNSKHRSPFRVVGRHALPTPLRPRWCQRRGLRVRVPQRRIVALPQLEDTLLAPGVAKAGLGDLHFHDLCHVAAVGSR